MSVFFSCMDRFLKTISSWALRISGFFLALMFILINVEVFGRYLFGFSTLISDEYVGYFFVWMTFLGYTATLRGGHFLRVNIILNVMPTRMSNMMQGIGALFGAVLCGILTWTSGHTVYVSFLFKSVSLYFSKTPLIVPQFIMPIGLSLLTLAMLHEGVCRLQKGCGYGGDADGSCGRKN